MEIDMIDEHNNRERNEGISNVAAFAISLLNSAGVCFSNKDLSFVNIPYSDLSMGIFHYTNFDHADLTGVVLS